MAALLLSDWGRFVGCEKSICGSSEALETVRWYHFGMCLQMLSCMTEMKMLAMKGRYRRMARPEWWHFQFQWSSFAHMHWPGSEFLLSS